MTDSSIRRMGAELSPEGVRYTAWAPEKKEMTVHIGQERELTLTKIDGGYFTAIDKDGRAGDLYTYTVDGRQGLPDLASRYQPQGLNGPSMVIDPAYAWKTPQWKRSTREQVIYELHVGTFTQAGTYRAAMERLDHLVDLGVTTVELMPLAQCTGTRNWGYDGVLLFAPYHVYGTPDDLRAFIDACHGHGLAVILDVIYNHIGAVGDSTHIYSQFFAHHEESGAWGKNYNLDGENSLPVRHFLLQNVAYWLDEFRFDGFRFDATHAIHDGSPTHFMAEATELVHARGGIAIAEDERNSAEIFKPVRDGGWEIDAMWSDDYHHALRVSLTGENHGYLGNFIGTTEEIADTLQHGWHYRGQISPHSKKPRGTASIHLPPSYLVNCISNHDQVGNRPYGERLDQLISPAAYRAISLFFCFTPYTPLLFMGQEWGASSPFLFFCDHPADFGRLVTEGREREFQFAAHQSEKPLPDCQAESTFQQSKLHWDEPAKPPHRETFLLYREALRLRREYFAGQNPARECWTVEAHPDHVTILYRWPNRSLEVSFWPSGKGITTEKTLLSSGEERFGGSPGEVGARTTVIARAS